MLNNLLTYLIESAVCFAIMYSFYKYVFYRSTQFEWNRWYFYIALFVCLAIPILPFPYSIINSSNSNNFLMISPSDGTGLMVFSAPSSFWSNFDFLKQNPYFNLNNVLLGIYFSGLIRYVIIFVRRNKKIKQVIRTSKKQKIDNYRLCLYKGKTTAFSWFRNIFINSHFLKLDPEEQTQILEHEKIHAQQRHTLDILLYEIFELFFWFSPFVKKSKQTLKNIHEFIVDAKITNKTNPEKYTNLLIKLSQPGVGEAQYNYFAKNQLFERIWLMAFPVSKKMRKLWLITGIPLLLATLICYSFVISEINRSTDRLQFINNTEFAMPLQGNYEIVSLFFMKKEVTKHQDNTDYKVLISHPEVSFSTESNSVVFATKKGVVGNIKQVDNWGVDEIEIEIKHNEKFTSKYKGLAKSLVKKGQEIETGQQIAETGDNRLYPTMGFQLLKNGQAVDPFQYINN